MLPRRPKILYLSNCWLYDQAYGGQLRALHIAKALQDLGSVSLVIVGADDVAPKFKSRTLEEFDFIRTIETIPVPVEGLRARLSSFLDPAFTNIHGIQADPAGESWLREAIAEFDLIWFSTLRTANSFQQARWPRSVIDVGDLPSLLQKSAAKSRSGESGGPKALWRKLVLQQHEKRVPHRFDVVAVCSEADRLNFRGRTKTHVIPNGFVRPASKPKRQPATPPRIGFVGLLEYFPNLDGVSWFAETCLPLIRREVPDISLRLIGAGTDGPLKPSSSAVEGLGWVEDPEEEIATWSVMIVPIRVGGGTRIKIADAFSRQCPVVSTSLGAYGYDVCDGQEIFLADTSQGFAAACLKLIQHPTCAREMAERAYDKFLRNWTWEAITPRVLETAEDGLRSEPNSERLVYDTAH